MNVKPLAPLHTRRMKNKTLATWLALVGGPLGLHRFYLNGLGDWLGWLHWIPTAMGLVGLRRVQILGVDDPVSWVLLPCAGFLFAITALTAIVYGLSSAEKWNARHNPQDAPDAPAGQTQWLTVGGIVFALLMGSTVLMSSIVYSFQRYFEVQVEAARKISQ